MANNYSYLLKYIIIGDSSVGKTNLLMKFTHNKFTDEYRATIGVEFDAKNLKIDEKIFRIQLWDTAGQENFRSITRAYYKNCVCALIIYDITKKQTFENIQYWLDDVRNESPKSALIILIGNKIDLGSERKVSYEEGSEFAKKNGIIFMETSARTGEGVDEMFIKSVKEIEQRIKDNFYDLTSETCGIKKGNAAINEENSNGIGLNDGGSKNKNKSCC